MILHSNFNLLWMTILPYPAWPAIPRFALRRFLPLPKGGGAGIERDFSSSPRGGTGMSLDFLDPPRVDKDYNCKFSIP